jgi:hypothetical protein
VLSECDATITALCSRREEQVTDLTSIVLYVVLVRCSLAGT